MHPTTYVSLPYGFNASPLLSKLTQTLQPLSSTSGVCVCISTMYWAMLGYLKLSEIPEDTLKKYLNTKLWTVLELKTLVTVNISQHLNSKVQTELDYLKYWEDIIPKSIDPVFNQIKARQTFLKELQDFLNTKIFQTLENQPEQIRAWIRKNIPASSRIREGELPVHDITEKKKMTRLRDIVSCLSTKSNVRFYFRREYTLEGIRFITNWPSGYALEQWMEWMKKKMKSQGCN
jgi:hypothetical protein